MPPAKSTLLLPPQKGKTRRRNMAVSQGNAKLDKGYWSKKVMREQPVDWSKDDLSRHWNDGASNMVTNFACGTNELQRMQAVDRLFMKIVTNLINSKNLVVALLLLRCHSAYRAATILAVSGMPTDVYPCISELDDRRSSDAARPAFAKLLA
jgi:hypothetical protein